jgi:hypothetical protein
MFPFITPDTHHQVVEVVLENYKPQKAQNEDQVTVDPDNESVQQVQKTEQNTSPYVIYEIPTWESIVNAKGGVNLSM